jgi:hypothetical protein
MSGKPYYTEPYIQNKFGDYTSGFLANPSKNVQDMAELVVMDLLKHLKVQKKLV